MYRAEEWARITKEDIPAVWRAVQVEEDGTTEAGLAVVKEGMGVSQETQVQFRVAVELPDYPLCRAWTEWYETSPSPEDVAVVVTPREAWIERRTLEREMLLSFIKYGKPASVWVGTWYRKPLVG